MGFGIINNKLNAVQDIKPKVKVYIDGANVFYTQKKLGWFVDWSKLKDFIESKKEVVEWRYYTGLMDNDEKMQKYLRHLDKIGFIAVTKPLKKIKIGEDGKFIYKANFDVEITVDILLDKFKLDEIIILSGDSDFVYLIKKLKDLGLKTSVYSSKKTISWELKILGCNITYFEKIKDKILREQK